MTEETAKQLIEAMNRLAAAIHGLTSGSGGSLTPGINVYHHGFPQPQTFSQGPYVGASGSWGQQNT